MMMTDDELHYDEMSGAGHILMMMMCCINTVAADCRNIILALFSLSFEDTAI